MIDFDANSGRLRLDADAFELLVTATSGNRKSTHNPILAEAGVFDEAGGSHLALAPGLLAVVGATCQSQLLVVDSHSRRLHQVWMTSDSAAMLTEIEGGLYEFATLRPGFVPSAFARICRLGPRREQPDVDVKLSKADAQALWSEDSDDRRKAAVRLGSGDLTPAWQQAMANESWWAWHATVFWDDGTTGRTLRVLDSQAGTFGFDDDALQPITSTELWRTILRMFASSDQVNVTA